MSRNPVQVARPEIPEITIPGPAPVLTQGFQKWSNRSERSTPKASVSLQQALGRWHGWTLALMGLLLGASGAQAQAVFPSQAVGTTSAQQTVTVTAQAAGTVNTVQVLTAGTPSLEFAAGAGASTCPMAVLTIGATCTESVTFTPAAPGLRIGAVVLLDITGKVLGTAQLSGTGTGGLGVLVPGNILTVAGVFEESTSTTDNISATLANLNQPTSIVLDGAGNLYIADSAHNRIRKVTPPVPPAAAGTISTIAGTGEANYTGDSGLATASTLDLPSGIAIDGAGNLYIADTSNNVIRKIAAATGSITTVAGGGVGCAGQTDSVGDGCPATSGELNHPQGVTVDISGNLYIADTANQRIRRVDVVTGILTTVAGDGALNPSGNGQGTFSGDAGPAINAGLNLPYAVAFDAAGNMYIPDSGNNVIRKVAAVSGSFTAASVITTIAGTGVAGFAGMGGLATAALLNTPEGVAFDAAGNLYIADTANASIRKINAVTGDINNLIVNGGSSTLSVAGTLGSVQVYQPVGLFLDGSGDVYFADSLNMIVQEVQSNKAILNFSQTAVTLGNESAPQSQTVENDGNVALDLTAITPDQNALLNAPTTTCAIGTPFLAVDSDCVVGAIFAPTVTGNPLLANIDVAADSINSPLDIVLVGDATEGTTVTLTSSLNPSLVGQSVTFTATVAAAPSSPGTTLTGTVTFFDGANVLQTVTLGAGGVATYSTATLTQGLHAITAVYSGVPNQFQTSTSNVVNQDVQASTATVVTSSLNPSNYGVPVTFTVTVTPNGTLPASGVVNLYDGTTQIGTANLVGTTNQVTFTTSTLAVGSHTITAAYLGNADYATSTSAAIIQVVNLAQTSTTVVATPNPGIAGTAEAITATVKVTAGVSTPTGTVTFKDTFNGATVTLGTLPLPASGIVTINPTTLAPGLHSIVATYSGDANDNGSASSPFQLNVVLATTAATVTATPNPALVQQTITFTAKVTGNGGTPTGSVSFYASGTILMGSANLDATGTATITYAGLAAGTYQITAVYAGEANNGPATSPAITEVVGAIPTITSLGYSTTTGPNPQVVLVATVLNNISNPSGGATPTPTGTVTFNSGTTVLGTATLDASGVATLAPNLLPGVTYTVVAVYSGDALHSPSTSPAVTVSGTPTDYTITVTPAAVTMATSQNATLNVTITSYNGFTDTIGLGCASLPAGVNCHFSALNVALAANATPTVQLTIDTNNPLGGGSTAMNAHNGNRGQYLAGLFLPFSLFLGMIVWRFRKRHAAVFTTVLVLLLSGATMMVSGCAGITQSTAAPGTYVIQVVGVGATSNISHYQNVTLTITR